MTKKWRKEWRNEENWIMKEIYQWNIIESCERMAKKMKKEESMKIMKMKWNSEKQKEEEYRKRGEERERDNERNRRK